MTSSPRRTLVIGAAGHAAGSVIPALAERGAWVRGMVRREQQQEAVRSRGARETIVGDLRRPDDVEAALSGMDAVFYIAPAFIPDEADIGLRVVESAHRAGVRRIVFSSVIHPGLSLINHRAKAPVEDAIYRSGMDYVVLQPSLFFQNFDGAWRETLRSGKLAEPWSANTRFSRVDYRDVAEAAAIGLTENGLVGGTFELAAPGHFDRHDVARLISEVTGHDVAAVRSDPERMDVTAPLRAMFEHYDHAGLLSNPLALRAILGREPRSLRRYFTELHAGR